MSTQMVCRNVKLYSNGIVYSHLLKLLQAVKGNNNQVFRHGIMLKCRWFVEEMPTDYPLNSELFEFRNEKIFSASLELDINSASNYVLVFKSLNHHKVGIQIFKVMLTLTCPGMIESDTTEMTPKENLENDLLKVYTLPTGKLPLPVTITYYIHVNEAIPNYRYELVDLLCMAQFWVAARRRQFTDFEFLVKGKVFSAHRAILAARSSVLANLLSQSGVDFLCIEDTDANVFEHFLHFIYTGRLTISGNNAQLLTLAERFQIDTLKSLCKNAAQGSGSLV